MYLPLKRSSGLSALLLITPPTTSWSGTCLPEPPRPNRANIVQLWLWLKIYVWNRLHFQSEYKYPYQYHRYPFSLNASTRLSVTICGPWEPAPGFLDSRLLIASSALMQVSHNLRGVCMFSTNSLAIGTTSSRVMSRSWSGRVDVKQCNHLPLSTHLVWKGNAENP